MVYSVDDDSWAFYLALQLLNSTFATVCSLKQSILGNYQLQFQRCYGIGRVKDLALSH